MNMSQLTAEDGSELLAYLGGHEGAQAFLQSSEKQVQTLFETVKKLLAESKFYEAIEIWARNQRILTGIGTLLSADKDLKLPFPVPVSLEYQDLKTICYLLTQPYSLEFNIGDESGGFYPVTGQISLPELLKNQALLNRYVTEPIQQRYDLIVGEGPMQDPSYHRKKEEGHPLFHETRFDFMLPSNSRDCEILYLKNGQIVAEWHLTTKPEGGFDLKPM